ARQRGPDIIVQIGGDARTDGRQSPLPIQPEPVPAISRSDQGAQGHQLKPPLPPWGRGNRKRKRRQPRAGQAFGVERPDNKPVSSGSQVGETNTAIGRGLTPVSGGALQPELVTELLRRPKMNCGKVDLDRVPCPVESGWSDILLTDFRDRIGRSRYP